MALGQLEHAVMEQLWAAREPLSVREVHLALTEHRNLAYTTVMTVLDRLTKKELARRERAGRAFRYTATCSRDDLVAEVMVAALEGDAADRTAALVAFVGKVSPDEAAVLRAALARLEESARS